jgi:hypothetical protein
MTANVAVKLKPVIACREFPFGTIHDPSMRELMAAEPGEHQVEVVEYLRSGYIVGVVMSADLPDWFDPRCRANPIINGRVEGGVTPMTDGVWLWPAGLIYFIEKYNVRVPQEFIDHAASSGWHIDKEAVSRGSYDYDY